MRDSDGTIVPTAAFHETTKDAQVAASLSRLVPNIDKALTWIEEYGDRDVDGFVEYGGLPEDGLIN